MSVTGIEWTDRVWNPVTGCTKVSQGCKHCYAETVAGRFWATQYPLVEIETGGPAGTQTRARRFTDVIEHAERLNEPSTWRKPQRVFVNSMSDLFHEDVSAEFIFRVLEVIERHPQHTFQVLTKRPQRMVDLMGGTSGAGLSAAPLKNLWLGVSVEDADTAATRIPLLQRVAAAVRFISAEPLLAPLSRVLAGALIDTAAPGHCISIDGEWWHAPGDPLCGRCVPRIDWVIVGGESGPGARPCHVEHVRRVVSICRSSWVPVFVKQLGAHVLDRNDAGFEGDKPGAWPMDTATSDLAVSRSFTRHQGDPVRVRLKHSKGGDPTEWPADLRIREFPRS